MELIENFFENLCILLFSFTFQMRSKTLKYVDQKKQGNISCEHENTLKPMDFSKSDEQLCLLTVQAMQ